MSGDPSPSIQPVVRSSDTHSVARRPSDRTDIQSGRRLSSDAGTGAQLRLTAEVAQPNEQEPPPDGLSRQPTGSTDTDDPRRDR